ncbi:MAG: M23 family metallopeptidase, partial [bacterium]
MKNRILYQLQLIPKGLGRRFQFTITQFNLSILILGFVFFWFGTAYVLGNVIAKSFILRDTANLNEENRLLKSQVKNVEERLNTLKKEIQALTESDNHLRLLADLPLIDSQVRQMGIGGVVNEFSSSSSDETVRNLIANLDHLERQVRLQHQSFQEIERKLNTHSEILAHTPSIRPVDGGYYSSGFGTRTDPFTRRKVFHRGIDISIPRGTPVKATADGVVVFAQQTPGLGKLVVIDHGYGMRTAYGHLNTISVVKGQNVKREQKIGTSGSTGRTTAPHLHYEVHINGQPVNPIDFIYDELGELLPIKSG